MSALLNNTASNNVVVGVNALKANTTGTQNTVLGTDSLKQIFAQIIILQ